MTAPPKYTKVASEDPAEQETEFEEVDSGSASPTPATSEPTPNETASVAVEEVVVPLRNASASDVRAYIVHLLVTKHGVISEAAHAVAAKWMLGRGFDFLEASSEEFDDIFGRDLGRHIYRSTVHDELLRWHTRQIQEGFMCMFTGLDKRRVLTIDRLPTHHMVICTAHFFTCDYVKFELGYFA